MALTRTIAIKERIFDAETLNNLLTELSGQYRKETEAYSTNLYLLHISEDETTTVSLDSPPSSFDPLLRTPVRYLSLRIHSADPQRDIELTLYHGSDSIHNSIRLHSKDEDWVNLAYGKISKVLNNTDAQSMFLPRYGGWFVVPLAFVVGSPLKNLLFIILKWLGLTKQVPWSWEVFFQHLLFAGVLGLLPAMLLLAWAAKAYPCVEIQTGPSRFWKEARLRSRLRIIFGILIVGPSANFLYDIYRSIFAP